MTPSLLYKTVCIYLFLSPFDFLFFICINVMGCLDASGIYNSESGTFLLTDRFPCHAVENIEKLFQHTFEFPLAEIVVNCLPRGKVGRQHSPLTAALADIEYGVQNFSETLFSSSFLWFHYIFDNLPLFFS